MANITPQAHLRGGIAAQSADEIFADHVDFVGGDKPAIFATVETILSGQNLPAMSVVGFNGDDKVVEADGATVKAVGVLPYAVDASDGDVGAEIWRGGNFKPEALVWNAGYADAAAKQKAFEGAPSPTQIVITPTRTFAV
ncbi:head decoration protein [Sulfitobacter pontiacus]